MKRQPGCKRVFVAQLVDAGINNPQVLNARALLSRVMEPGVDWIAPYYNAPDPELVGKENIRLVKLCRWRFWQWHKCLLYQSQIDAIFYPGAYWFDDWGLRLRRLCGRRVPVIATLEGLAGNDARAREYSEWAGHPVYCQNVEPGMLSRVDRVLSEADHVIAISPFLARVGAKRYGEKFSVLPLGIDSEVFHAMGRGEPERFRVVGAGRLYDNKRPQLFLDMAERWPQADFIWFGDGEMRGWLLAEKLRRSLGNVDFPGPIAHNALGDEFRKSSLFVLPSLAEGVPKVTQEAAACGLPVVCFGFYEAPSVVDGANGFVVWDDDALFSRVGELISDVHLARRMGEIGVEMAKDWDWKMVARRWEELLILKESYNKWGGEC